MIFVQHYLQENIIGIYGFSTEFLSEKLINQFLDFKIMIYKVFLITKHLFIAIIKYPIWIVISISLIFTQIFNDKKNNYLKYFLYALIINVLFVYAIYINDPSPINNASSNGSELLYEFVLNVTLDRVIFQTSGFYILIFILLLNKIIKINKKYD